MIKINLSNGMYANFDEIDLEKCSKYVWRAYSPNGKLWYAITYLKGKPLFMHKLLLSKIPINMEIDHRDGNGLNNCRINLRVCSHAQNMANRRIQKNNTSGFKGVWRHNKKNLKNNWVAEIYLKGTRKHLGYFATNIEAAKAYDKAAIKYFGEFAKTNESLGLFVYEKNR